MRFITSEFLKNEVNENVGNEVVESKYELVMLIAKRAKQIAEELFSNKGVSENMPSTTISKEKLGINILDLLVETNLVSSKSEARRLVEQNGISINQTKESDVKRIIDESDFKDGFIVIQKGKKVFLKIKIEA